MLEKLSLGDQSLANVDLVSASVQCEGALALLQSDPRLAQPDSGIYGPTWLMLSTHFTSQDAIGAYSHHLEWFEAKFVDAQSASRYTDEPNDDRRVDALFSVVEDLYRQLVERVQRDQRIESEITRLALAWKRST